LNRIYKLQPNFKSTYVTLELVIMCKCIEMGGVGVRRLWLWCWLHCGCYPPFHYALHTPS